MRISIREPTDASDRSRSPSWAFDHRNSPVTPTTSRSSPAVDRAPFLQQRLTATENALRNAELKVQQLQKDLDAEHQLYWAQSRKLRAAEKRVDEMHKQMQIQSSTSLSNSSVSAPVSRSSSRTSFSSFSPGPHKKKPMTVRVGQYRGKSDHDGEARLWYNRYVQCREAFVLAVKTNKTLEHYIKEIRETVSLDFAELKELVGDDIDLSDLMMTSDGSGPNGVMEEQEQGQVPDAVLQALTVQKILNTNDELLERNTVLQEQLNVSEEQNQNHLTELAQMGAQVEQYKHEIIRHGSRPLMTALGIEIPVDCIASSLLRQIDAVTAEWTHVPNAPPKQDGTAAGAGAGAGAGTTVRFGEGGSAIDEYGLREDFNDALSKLGESVQQMESALNVEEINQSSRHKQLLGILDDLIKTSVIKDLALERGAGGVGEARLRTPSNVLLEDVDTRVKSTRILKRAVSILVRNKDQAIQTDA